MAGNGWMGTATALDKGPQRVDCCRPRLTPARSANGALLPVADDAAYGRRYPLNRPSCPRRGDHQVVLVAVIHKCESAAQAKWSRSAFASFRSAVSKPSLNQP